MKLLLTTGNSLLLKQQQQFFRKAGYICESATTATEINQKINHYEYEGIIIDGDLNWPASLSTIEVIRRNDHQVAIIFLSSIASSTDRIRALELGADDMVMTPVDLTELYARLKAIFRRSLKTYDHLLTFGELVINPDERNVWAQGQLLTLTRKEFDILHYLIRHKNQVITKEQLAEQIWGDFMDHADSFDFIYAHVKNLRKKLLAHNCGEFLKTIYGIGYKFQT